MTKINSSTSQPLEDLDTIEGEPGVGGGVSQSGDEVGNERVLVEDTVVEDEEGFFESLGSSAGEMVDDAIDSAEEALPSFKPHELIDLGTGPMMHEEGDFTTPELPGPVDLQKAISDLPTLEESGIAPLGNQDFDGLENPIPSAEDVVQSARDFARTLDLPGDLEKIPSGIILDATDAAAETYEKYVQRGESPLEPIYNVPGAAERVMGNVNDAMKDVFGEDAQQFTLEPSLKDIEYTVQQLVTPYSKLRQQAKTALTLGAFEVLRENAGVVGNLAETRTAEAVSELYEDTADIVVAMGIMGVSVIGGLPGMAGGAILAKKILSDEVELPYPGADDVSEFMRDIEANPTEYRKKLTRAQGPFAGHLDALETGETYSSWTSFGGKAGKGGVLGADITFKASAQKLDDQTFKIELKASRGLSVGVGARLKEMGLDVSLEGDHGAKATLIVTGPKAAKAAAAMMRGELVPAALAGGMPDVEAVEMNASRKLSMTAQKVLNTSVGGEMALGLDHEKVTASVEIEGNGAVSLFDTALKVKGLGDEEGATRASEIIADFTSPAGTSFSTEASVSAKFAIEAGEDGSLAGVIELELNAARQDIEARGQVNLRITDLEKFLDANGMTRDEVLKLGKNNPEKLAEMLGDGDFGVKVEAKAQVRDVDSVELDLILKKEGGAVTSAWRDVENDLGEAMGLA